MRKIVSILKRQQEALRLKAEEKRDAVESLLTNVAVKANIVQIFQMRNLNAQSS